MQQRYTDFLIVIVHHEICTYAEVVKNFRQTGSVVKKHVKTKTVNNKRNKENIVAKVNQNPENGISKSSII